ncbi:hypothetical protein CK203_096318 [Vitis vinifera]|uniref:Uncharacterized protein n=1 Tax=Vitis vinifera TaxID=29760 RepID=A0A438F4U2_VITVI|nr:hypothetical protein CK203_096318 [Vitis vinifera]
MANAHRRRNFLEKLKVNGVLLVGKSGIKEGVAGAFQLMLSEMGEWRPSIEGLVFNSLSLADSAALEFPFSEEEILSYLLSRAKDGDFIEAFQVKERHELGLPLDAPYKPDKVWECGGGAVIKRLALWKKRYLSKGGR